MKKSIILVVLLALVLTFVFAASAFATTGKFYKGGVDYYTWSQPTGSAAPGTGWVQSGLSGLGANPVNPGVHANYLANTAKCGICHSVHRAAASGTKLLPTGDATCAGCHTGGTAITAKIITVGVVNMNWRVGAGLPAFSSGGAGPHNDALDTMYADGEWDGISTPPSPSFSVEPFQRYGCFTRRCHATNPHGANSSKYTIMAAKLLFNDSPAQDDATNPGLVTKNGAGTYGGLDAVYDNLGASDASVQRFADANPGIITLSGSSILIHGVAPDANETHALVAGLTCGRPSNPATGEDECHSEASYAIVDKGIVENRNHGTKILGAGYVTDNTGSEVAGFGGNDNRNLKTGHVAGTFAAVPGSASYVAIAGCTSCHDQTDSANTVAGNFTFPHGQTPTGVTNATAVGGGSGTMVRSRIWSGWSGSALAVKTVTDSTSKAFDGQCLKCHRDGAGAGVGLTK
jgi:predicted CXXCH cytochrome family protein